MDLFSFSTSLLEESLLHLQLKTFQLGNFITSTKEEPRTRLFFPQKEKKQHRNDQNEKNKNTLVGGGGNALTPGCTIGTM